MYCSRQHLNLITKPHSSILQTATSSPTFRPLTTRGAYREFQQARTGPEKVTKSAKTHAPLAPEYLEHFPTGLISLPSDTRSTEVSP